MVLLFVLLIYSASALTVETKPVYQPKETMIVEIAGNILEPILPESVIFKRNNVEVPVQYDVKNLGGRYFLYAILPQNENNYTFTLEEVATTVNGIPEIIDFSFDVFVFGNLTPYSIEPGFIITQEETAAFNIFLNRDFPETITSSQTEAEIILQPGNNEISLSLSGLEPDLHFISIGIYEIPVLIAGAGVPLSNLPLVRFVPVQFEATDIYVEGLSYEFIIVNEGTEPLHDVTLAYDDSHYLIEPSAFEIIGAGTSETLSLTVLSQSDIEDTVVLRAGSFESEMGVMIRFTEDEGQVITPPHQDQDFSEEQQYYCSQLSGRICTGGEVCSIATIESRDALFCCTGSCVSPDETGGSDLAVIGYLLAALIIVVGAAIAYKYYTIKKTRRKPAGSKEPRPPSEIRPRSDMPPRPPINP